MCHNERMGFAPYFSLQADLVSTCQLSSRLCGKAIYMVSTQSANYAKLPRNMCEDKACLSRMVTANLVLMCFQDSSRGIGPFQISAHTSPFSFLIATKKPTKKLVSGVLHDNIHED